MSTRYDIARGTVYSLVKEELEGIVNGNASKMPVVKTIDTPWGSNVLHLYYSTVPDHNEFVVSIKAYRETVAIVNCDPNTKGLTLMLYHRYPSTRSATGWLSRAILNGVLRAVRLPIRVAFNVDRRNGEPSFIHFVELKPVALLLKPQDVTRLRLLDRTLAATTDRSTLSQLRDTAEDIINPLYTHPLTEGDLE